MIRSYKDLVVWQRSIELADLCYALTRQLPHWERFGMTSQIQRAAVSIAANIAEGHSRDHLGDYLYHLSVAKGSLTELETLLLLTERTGQLPEGALRPARRHADEVGRMLETLSKRLRARRKNLEPRT